MRQRPRLLPDLPLPPYAYVPGRHPHPTRDVRGHSYGKPPTPTGPADLQDWCSCSAYLLGIDLFNHGYYWEAHEAWEALWRGVGSRGPNADFLKGLIALAAAGVKAGEGNSHGIIRHAGRAATLFSEVLRSLEADDRRLMGLALDDLVRAAKDLADPSSPDAMAAFDLVLRPG